MKCGVNNLYFGPTFYSDPELLGLELDKLGAKLILGLLKGTANNCYSTYF